MRSSVNRGGELVSFLNVSFSFAGGAGKARFQNGCGREKTCVELAPPIFCFLPENYG